MSTVKNVLEKNQDSMTFKKLMAEPEFISSGSKCASKGKVTIVFMGLLAFNQIGMVELNQDFEGKQDDIRKGKFRN